MDNKTIKEILRKELSLNEVYINSNKNHHTIIIISEIFNGMNNLQKQKTVYKPLMELIINNHIHAISIKAYTPQEWQKKQKL